MPHEWRECGGDQHQGAVTPGVIAARTPEDAPPETTGVPHLTANDRLAITTDVLWPLVVTLGEIAQRVTPRARDEQHDVT